MAPAALGRLQRVARLRAHHYRVTFDVVRLTFALSRQHTGVIAAFVLLALVNALTESFTIMLMVPLLESISSSSVFSGVPVLGGLGELLAPMDPLERLRWVAAILLVVIVVKGAVQFFVDVIVYVMPLRLERDLRMRAFSALMESTITFADGLSAGDTGNYTASFPARAGLALRFLIQFISASLTIVLMLAVLVAITPSALIGLLGFALLGSLAFRALTGPLSRRLDAELTDSQRDFTQAYFEAINNNRTIRVFNAGDTYLRRIQGLLERLRKTQVQTIAVQNATFPFFSTLAGLLVCGAVLVASFTQPENAQDLLSVLLVFLVAASRLLGPFSLAHISRMHFAIHAVAVREMSDFLASAADNHDVDGEIPLEADEVAVAFDHVRFTYPGTEAGIRDVTFEAQVGEFVAIVGPSGSGKSTIFHLLSRLHRPDAGTIRLNGIDLDDVEIRTWWTRMSIVSQNVPIFNGSVRENVLFGVGEDVVDEARLHEALRLSAADEFVAAMPDGVDAHLGEFGSNLSGGERQRLALARAFYHQPPVVLLDEVTSQLDTDTEQKIAASIGALHARGHTIIAIAHRPSTIRGADRILVLDEGRLIADGHHAGLLEDNAFYRRMAAQS